VVKTLSVSEEELFKEYDKWEESVTKALESDETLRRIVYEEIKNVSRYAAGSEVSFDDYADMLSDVVDKVRSYVREKHGIELQDCYVKIDALPKWANYFKRELEKNKPLSSVRLFVRCIIPLPKKFEELDVPLLGLEIDTPLFFEYPKYKGRWHISLAPPPRELSDIRVIVNPQGI